MIAYFLKAHQQQFSHRKRFYVTVINAIFQIPSLIPTPAPPYHLHLSLPIRDRLEPQKLLQSPTTVEPSPSTILDASMRQPRLIMHTHAVNMHRATLNLPCHGQRSREVLGEHAGRQTVLGVVGDGDGLGRARDGEQADAGAEALGVVDLHLLGDAGDDDGPDAVGAGVVDVRGRVGREQEFGAVGLGVVEQRLVLLDADLRDERGRGGGGGVPGG